MSNWDEVVCRAIAEAAAAIVCLPGQAGVGETSHLQPALAAALERRFGERVAMERWVRSLPDWNPVPGDVDILIGCEGAASVGASPAVGIETKSDKLDQTIWDIFKMASLRRMAGVEAVYVVAAATLSRFSGSTDGAALFNTPLEDAEEWHSIYFFNEWPKAVTDLYKGGSARPTRVPRRLFVQLVCICEIPAFPGWEVRALRIENPVDHGWLLLDKGWPDRLDPDPFKGWPRQIGDADLTLADLPGPDAEEGDYHSFALSIDGYATEGNLTNCARLANNSKQQWNETGELPQDLRSLRSCLFFEQRRAHHSGYDFDARTFAYVRALTEGIRAHLGARES